MSDATPLRTCTKCGEPRPLDQFCKDRQKRDGLHPHCKTCRMARSRAYVETPQGLESRRRATRKWRSAHPEESAESGRAWRLDNPTYSADHNRQWREVNPEAAREYYLANRDAILERTKAYGKANPELKRRIMAAWRERNPGVSAERTRAWQKANPDKARDIRHRRRARKKAATVGATDLAALWEESLGLCGICASPIDLDLIYPDPMSKSVDHIVPLALGGTHEQSNLQWAHLVCNNRKGATVPVTDPAA